MGTNTKRELLKSDLGLSMADTIERIKTHKGNHAMRGKMTDMQGVVTPLSDGLIHRAYENGVKTAEDVAASNEEINDHLQNTKIQNVLRKMRVGWTHPARGMRKSVEQRTDERCGMATNLIEDAPNLQINQSSPEIQDPDTGESSWEHLRS